jgi:hypothetical protein
MRTNSVPKDRLYQASCIYPKVALRQPVAEECRLADRAASRSSTLIRFLKASRTHFAVNSIPYDQRESNKLPILQLKPEPDFLEKNLFIVTKS